nr:uncharacterized protein LOC128675849 [Plodia interpunctella]
MDVFMIFACLFFSVNAQSLDVNETKIEDSSSVVLSRRKRFIVFPEGSSLQLVFCTTYPLVLSIGDIFLWGNTAALAFELPQDPYSPFMHHADPLHRRMDSKAIYYTDEDGKVLYKRPYKRKFMVNPAFAKRSVDATEDQFETEIRGKFEIDRKQMHASKNKRKFLKSEHMEGRSVEFHRSSRGVFYQRTETMLRGLGLNGRECLLRTLCLVGQNLDAPQGSLLQEILRAVFTLPKSKIKDENFTDYDKALSASQPCDVLYPDCDIHSSEPGFTQSF